MTYRQTVEQLFNNKVLCDLHYGKRRYELEINPENGFLTNIQGFTGKIVLYVNINPSYPFHLINVCGDASKSIKILDDEAIHENDIELTNWYKLEFPLVIAERSGNSCVKYPGNPVISNDFRLMRLVGNKLEMWRIAIVSQDEDLYFLPSLQYSGELREDQLGNIHVLGYPKLGFDRWVKLQPALVILADGISLKQFSEHPKESFDYEYGGHDVVGDQHLGMGEVIFYDPAVHYGAVRIWKNNNGRRETYCVARVHISQIISARKPNILNRGEIVKIGSLTPDVVNTRRFATVFNTECLNVVPLLS